MMQEMVFSNLPTLAGFGCRSTNRNRRISFASRGCHSGTRFTAMARLCAILPRKHTPRRSNGCLAPDDRS